MNKRVLIYTVIGALSLIAGMVAQAQSAYFQAVTSLNPVAYWPLNETTPPPQPLNLTAANLGSLGAVGNGYYGAWYQPSGNTWYLTNNIVQTAGATADGDKAMECQYAPGQYVILPRNTNGVPNGAITINAPFSIETWVQVGTVAARLGDLISEGEVQLNAGGPNTNNPFYGGTGGTAWAGFEVGQYQNFFFFSCFNTNAYNTKTSELDGPKTLVVGQWVHLVVTFDGSKETMFQNGVQVGQKTLTPNAAGLTYVPDPTSPLMIGSGGVPSYTYGVPFAGGVDEVAIYTNVLPQSSITAHYQTAGGTNATYGANYASAVLADNPLIYYRMDDAAQSQTSVGYPSAGFPVATNYGGIGSLGDGVYQPGTTPGVAGPAYAGFGPDSRSVAINGWLGAVDVGNSNIPASLNPTGAVPMTVVSWFQTGPADAPGRFQEIVGHSDSSYRLSLGTVAGENHFNPGPGPELQFTSAADVATNGFAFNDGQWHMTAGVSDGTNEYLYLDGVIAKTNGNAAGINIIGTTRDLLLGGDPQYTFASISSTSSIRNFDGQIAHVAFWTNALTSAQIQSLFAAAGVPPYLWQEPKSTTNNAGVNVTVPAGIRGSALTYQWYQNGAPVAGQTGAALTLLPATAGDAGSYYVIANNSYGAVTSSVVNVVIYGAPTIQEQSLTDMEIFSGASPKLQVTALGAQPITYQWTLNGSPILDATNSSYTVNDVQTSGTYGCTLVNSVNTAAINPISLTVLSDPATPYPQAVLADGPVAYYRLDEASGTTAYDYVGGNNGTYTNVSLGQPGYTSENEVNNDPNETAAGFGFINPPNDYAGNVPSYLNFGTANGGNAEFSVEAWITEYEYAASGNGIVALGYGNGGEQFVLDTGNGTAGTLRFLVRNAAGTTSSAGSSKQLADDGLWHHVVGVCDEAAGKLSLYLDGQLVASGTITAGSGLLASTTPLSIGARQTGNNGGTNYDAQFYGSVDDVAIYNKPLSASQVQAHYLQFGIAPQITQVQPSSVVTNTSANVTFSVTASGTPPFSYQWTDNQGNPIAWATNATLTLTNVQASQSGVYTVNVTSLYGGPVSATVNLTVTQAPQIVTDVTPSNFVTYATSPVTLTVAVSGSSPLNYQWYQNGVLIPNATNTTYSFDALPGTNTYYLSVTNVYSAGTPTVSSTATVVGLPAITLTPADYTDKLKITFAGYNRSETLYDFPVLVRLSTNLSGFNYSHFADPDGGDLRFTDSGGTRAIPFEINQWNTNGESTVWVQMPTLSGTNASIQAYWGNPGDATPPDYATNGAVWLSPALQSLPPYDLVYHLEQNGFPYLDSTLQYTATNGIAPVLTNGEVGSGESFNRVAYLNAGTVSLGNEFTLSAWVNVSSNVSDIQCVWANGPGVSGSSEIFFYVNDYKTSDGALVLATGNGSTAGNLVAPAGSVTLGEWHLLTASVDRADGLAQLYVDGGQVASGTIRNDFSTNSGMDLGQDTGNTFAFLGVLDESRIHSGLESSNWVWASWATVAQTTNLESYSTVSSTVTPPPPSPVTVQVQFSGGNLTLSGTGGSANGTYYVMGSTNLALPMAQWTVLSTNQFDGNGNFSVSVPVDATKPTQYLRIKE